MYHLTSVTKIGYSRKKNYGYCQRDEEKRQEFLERLGDVKASHFVYAEKIAYILSVASIWEAIIKYQLGKRLLPESPEVYLPKQRDRHRLTSLTIDEEIKQAMKLF